MSFFSTCDKQSSNTKTQHNEPSVVTPVLEEDSTSTEEETTELLLDNPIPYQLENPIATFKLPNKLREISGLGIDSTGNVLYAVQDEEGKIFKINSLSGEVIDEIEFHKDGDYEGIEYVGGSVFVVKSSGTLYEVKHLGEKNQELIKHKFTFGKHSDVEGLGFDVTSNRLLVSCKGKSGDEDDANFQKGVYSIDLAEMTMGEKPAYIISLDSIKAFLDIHPTLEKLDKLVKLFSPEEEFIFGPSGIAVHPKTRDVYVISSVGKLLIVLDHEGRIKNMVKLKKKLYEQPEGITFDQFGTLYISNEGKEQKGMVYKFVYQE